MQLQSDNLRNQAVIFLDKATACMDAVNLDIQNWSIDHLCYRVETFDRYEEVKLLLSCIGTLLGESDVGGRPIATYKLFAPIRFAERIIDLIELPAPKPGKNCAEGFEHLEIVLPIPFQRLMERHPNLQFDTSGLKKPFNQELKLPLEDGIGIKFHHLSLESVINLENNTIVFNALSASNILKVLREYDPLIAGTYPLGVHTENSDIDIIASAQNISAARILIRKTYGQNTDFHDRMTSVKGRETYIANFTWEKVPFEIFIQTIPSVEGTAYKHFLIEERLLKVKGPAFSDTIRTLRTNENLKTEPAFAKALRLEGDPYQALFGLSHLSELELI